MLAISAHAQGVLINATSDFGGFNAMMYLDPSEKVIEPYMANLVQFFTGVCACVFSMINLCSLVTLLAVISWEPHTIGG